jgi:hypothetical protein
MLRNLSNPIKLELVVLLSESMEDSVAAMTDETEEERKVDTDSNRPAGVLADRNNAMLDAALAEFSGDFGGNANAGDIARELRQGPEMVRDVEIW